VQGVTRRVNAARLYDAAAARFRARFAARTGFSGANVDAVVSTTRGDENVRRPCASKSMIVWNSLALTKVPSPYCE
jgi:hypothetical protein